MARKEERKLCWNCEGNISKQLELCPYCGVDLTNNKEGSASFFSSASASLTSEKAPPLPESPFKSPYASVSQLNPSDDEWTKALELQSDESEESVEEKSELVEPNETLALLLFFPGVILFFFGLILFFFSEEGSLTLQWNQNFAYFYCLGSLPLLYLGWKAFR